MPLRPPVGYFAVTMPVVTTVVPTSGLLAASVPWISAMVLSRAGSPGGVTRTPEFCGFGARGLEVGAVDVGVLVGFVPLRTAAVVLDRAGRRCRRRSPS